MAKQSIKLIIFRALARRLHLWADMALKVATEELPPAQEATNEELPPAHRLSRTDPTGPPAHWLARVQQGAPELLKSSGSSMQAPVSSPAPLSDRPVSRTAPGEQDAQSNELLPGEIEANASRRPGKHEHEQQSTPQAEALPHLPARHEMTPTSPLSMQRISGEAAQHSQEAQASSDKKQAEQLTLHRERTGEDTPARKHSQRTLSGQTESDSQTVANRGIAQQLRVAESLSRAGHARPSNKPGDNIDWAQGDTHVRYTQPASAPTPTWRNNSSNHPPVKQPGGIAESDSGQIQEGAPGQWPALAPTFSPEAEIISYHQLASPPPKEPRGMSLGQQATNHPWATTSMMDVENEARSSSVDEASEQVLTSSRWPSLPETATVDNQQWESMWRQRQRQQRLDEEQRGNLFSVPSF